MQFTWAKTGDRVFAGPDKTQGLLACWSVGTLRTVKAALKIPKLDELELFELQLLYFVLSVRTEDPNLIPFRDWENLQLDHFRIAPHPVTSYDDDGDCGDCNAPIEQSWHTGVDVPPTTPTPTSDPTEDDVENVTP